MKSLLILLALLVFLDEIKNSRSDEDLLVTLKQGILRGFIEKSTTGRDIYSFLRVPYMEPPIGNLRFKDPVPAGPWQGILNADKEIDYCIQITVLDSYLATDPLPQGSEDCIYLNVFTPNLKKDAELPVMVYFHGGMHIRGGAKEYKPYVLLNEDVILVVVQYRLNIFGFLSTEDFAISGNFGIKDGIESLRWVQANIREFGGDPDRVTIFGHSSGGGFSHLLVLSPKAKGLVHGAILQAGNAFMDLVFDRNDATEINQLIKDVGCESKEDTEIFIKCMQGVDAMALFAALMQMMSGSPLKMLTPIVDAEYLPDKPISILKEKRHNSINLMTGMNRDDGAFAGLMSKVIADSPEYSYQFVSGLMTSIEHLSQEDAERVHAYYFSKDNSWNEWNQFWNDYMCKVSMKLVSMSENEDSIFKVYTWQLDHRGQYSYSDYFKQEIEGKKDWIIHVDELFYLWYGGPTFPTPLERKDDLLIRDLFVKLWTNFAKTGNPTPDDSLGFKWDPVTENNQHLSINLDPHMEDDDRPEAIDFWLSLPLNWIKPLMSDQGVPLQAEKAARKEEL